MNFLNTLFLPMLAGHLIADFWLQPTSWVNHKKEKGWKSRKLIIHALICALIPVLFTFQPGLWWFVPVIFVTHFLVDFLKSQFKESIAAFLLDQFLHIGVLGILVFFFTKTTIPEKQVVFWVYAVGLILVTNPLGILTGLFLKSVTKAESNSAKLDASAWIGILERILILIFVTAGQFSAIGFLIAAKSVFRFNEAKEGGNRKAEYFLLGTLVSFALAIVVGLGIITFSKKYS